MSPSPGNGSIVRKCRSKSSEFKDYAVKILELSDSSYEDVEDLLDSTTKEVACMRLCHEHPNICRSEESFFTSSYIFLVLELCDGGEQGPMTAKTPGASTSIPSPTSLLGITLHDILQFQHICSERQLKRLLMKHFLVV